MTVKPFGGREFTLLRSARRSVSAEVTRDGEIIVRAPMEMPEPLILGFLDKHREWIERKIVKQRELALRYPQPSMEEAARLRILAARDLPLRAARFAEIMGVRPRGIKITSARKRFGSCGPKGLCFSYLLMRYPEAAIDYVVVHELAHIRYPNHGKAFYNFIESVLPDYKERAALLKE